MTSKKINRRDFLRLAGLASISLPANRIIGASHQIDKSNTINVADEAGHTPRPWWVKTIDQPTISIDWDKKQRFDARHAVNPGGMNFADFVGEERSTYLQNTRRENQKNRILDEKPGYTLKDYSLYSAQAHDIINSGSFLGPQIVPTPAEREVPKWEGSKDESARIIRVAMRQFGAAQVGFVELDERTRKLIFSFEPDGKEITFEDVDRAYETNENRVIPDNVRWVIAYTVQMSNEAVKRAPTMVANQATMSAYTRGRYIQRHTQEFLRGLGYQCLGQAPINGLGLSVAFAVLSGLGELSRTNRMITPEFGPMVRTFFLLTDLPVTVDKPIDAGIMEFCKYCKKCTESCPAGALSFSDDPTWEIVGNWNSAGHKTYYEDSVKCFTYWQEHAGTDCGICLAVCPFSKKDKAWIHQWVKASISVLPVLDGFFRSMDDAFSYGAQKDSETWWRLNLPEFGVDSDQST